MADVAGPVLPDVLRATPRVRIVVNEALSSPAIDPVALVDAQARAWPDGRHVLELTAHAEPRVREAALRAAAATGNPGAVRAAVRLREDADPAVAACAAATLARPLDVLPPRRYELLGGFAVRRGGWAAAESDWTRPLAARLVRHLAVHAGSVVTEDELFEAFWPDRDPDAARRALQVNLSHARAVLDLPGQQSVIELSARTYRLRLDEGDHTDVQRFERAAQIALDHTGRERAALLQAAEDEWGGTPLPDERYSDWTTAWREHLIDRRLQVLAALAGARREAGDIAGCVDAANRLVAADPLNEAAYRELMLAHARAGRIDRALAAFMACRKRMVDDLGIEPSADTRALHARILAGEPVA